MATPDLDLPPPPGLEEQSVPPPPQRCFVGPCPLMPVWAVTGSRGRLLSTVAACHVHMMEILDATDVQVVAVRALDQDPGVG